MVCLEDDDLLGLRQRRADKLAALEAQGLLGRRGLGQLGGKFYHELDPAEDVAAVAVVPPALVQAARVITLFDHVQEGAVEKAHIPAGYVSSAHERGAAAHLVKMLAPLDAPRLQAAAAAMSKTVCERQANSQAEADEAEQGCKAAGRRRARACPVLSLSGMVQHMRVGE